MAVYIKQSPPREGVRGGWEDFNWESLKTQSHADRDYYLGASAKVGICTRGKFEKFDWWTKKKESGGPNGEGDDELRRVKRFEQQLLEEALGQRPRHLLAGEALQDDEPSKPVAAPEGSAAAAKALKKLKKEQKRLKKLRKKEQKREARRLRSVKRERRSDSRSSRESSLPVSSSSRSESRGRSDTYSRRQHRRSRSASNSPHRSGMSGGALRFKKRLPEDSRRSGRTSHAREMEKTEGRKELHEKDSRKRRRSHSPERGRQKSTRGPRSPQVERQRVEADYHSNRRAPEGYRRERQHSREGVQGRRRRHSNGASDVTSHRREIRMEEHTQPRRDNSEAVVRRQASQEHCCCSTEPTTHEVTGQRRGIKAELVEEEPAREPGRHRRSPAETRRAGRDSEVLRVKREH